MDKQFQRLLELEKKKDNGTITKSEQTRFDKLIWRYIRKIGKTVETYQKLLLEQKKVIDKQTIYLTVMGAKIKDFHQFINRKGLLEEYEHFSQQNKKL